MKSGWLVSFLFYFYWFLIFHSLVFFVFNWPISITGTTFDLRVLEASISEVLLYFVDFFEELYMLYVSLNLCDCLELAMLYASLKFPGVGNIELFRVSFTLNVFLEGDLMLATEPFLICSLCYSSVWNPSKWAL
jgi:hypothetical protein